MYSKSRLAVNLEPRDVMSGQPVPTTQQYTKLHIDPNIACIHYWNWVTECRIPNLYNVNQ